MIKNDYIKIRRYEKTLNRFILISKNEFFSSEIIVKINEDEIIFTKPTIDYSGKLIKPTKTNKKGNWYSFSLYSEHIKEGKFLISEESNEDKIIIDYEYEYLQEE